MNLERGKKIKNKVGQNLKKEEGAVAGN